MAFKTTISVCLKNNCEALQVTDTTNVFNDPANLTGWGDVTTVAASEVESATLIITYPNGSETEIDVTADIPDPVTGEFVFPDISPETGSKFQDGEYKFTYVIVTVPGANNPGTYETVLCVYFTCNAECYVNCLWADVAKNLCGSSCDASSAMEIAFMAEGYLRAIKSAAASGKSGVADSLLAKLTNISNINDCNC